MIFFKILVVFPCVRKIALKTVKFSSKKAKKIFKLFMKFAENCQILTKISFNLTQKLNNILSYITKIMPKISAVEESHKTNFFLLEPSTLLKMTKPCLYLSFWAVSESERVKESQKISVSLNPSTLLKITEPSLYLSFWARERSDRCRRISENRLVYYSASHHTHSTER